MSDSTAPTPKLGDIAWRDLTVADATCIKDFYCAVTGWKSQPHDMGEYVDYNILASDGTCVAGICHARGSNANVPPQWLIYINVDDVDQSAQRCCELGGSIVDGPRAMGHYRFCVIRDPAGAVAAIISRAK